MNRRGLLALGLAGPLAFAASRVLAQSPTRLEITVLDGETPVSGISVQVESAALPDGEIAITTESDGVARLPLESDGQYDVRVETPGFQIAWIRDVRVEAGSTTSVTVTIVPRGPGIGSY